MPMQGGDNSNGDQPGWQEFDDFTNTNSNVVTQPLYRRNYIGIFRANTVLHQSQVESPAVEVFKAEAKFFAGLLSLRIVQAFWSHPCGDRTARPWRCELGKKYCFGKFFNKITTDLEEASAVLPITVSSGETGRATKGAALALLGKAYLYWGDILGDDQAMFDQAANYLQQVVDLGRVSIGR